MKRIRILPTCSMFGPCFLNIEYSNKKYFPMQNYNQIMEYFFPETLNHSRVNMHDPADICLTSIALPADYVLRKNECNVMICIENLENSKHINFYAQYKHFNNYNNEQIRIYIYSHIHKLVKTERYLAVPAIYCRINYFKQKYDFYKNHPSLNCEFKNKNFCLLINQSGLNPNINIFKNEMEKYGTIDDIRMYSHQIKNKSCYNSIELLEVLNKYKFIICFENSYSDGYITEKIFNCFFAKTIPLYSGSPIVERFFDEKAFINIDQCFENKMPLIERLCHDEELYTRYINHNKISEDYDDENYKEEMMNYL